MAARHFASGVFAAIVLVGGCRGSGSGPAAATDGGLSDGSLAADAPAIPSTEVGDVQATADARAVDTLDANIFTDATPDLSVGSGGASGSGGTQGSGGAGAAGTTASGGTVGSGGSGGAQASGGAGAAGTTASGGTVGSGGAQASGGAGSAGTTAVGGTVGTAGSGGAQGSGGAGSGGMTASGGTGGTELIGGRVLTTFTLGGGGTTFGDFQRASVLGSDGNKYVIQNNNFGNPSGSDQTISVVGNSFTVTSSTASSSSTTTPASFPSVYIGANGDIEGGTFATTATDHLPMQITSIGRVLTSFAWSGGTGGKDFNAAYDVWFASAKPTPGSYSEAVSGFLMIWLYQPPSRTPIGNQQRIATVAGHNWNVWAGTRGTDTIGTDGPNRPVVSYVATDSPLASLSFDLNRFIEDAAASGLISPAWYLTDVFGGFQIWTGSDAVGLACKSFTCVVR
jgi:hypothetical protein